MHLKQLEYPFTFIRPTTGFTESVPFEGVGRYLPVVLAQFDQPLRQTDHILEVYIGVDHPVADEQGAFQAR